MTRREIAELAAVRRETVTTWAARNADFPKPVDTYDGVEYFSLAEILDWLAGRVVPTKGLREEERPGRTYADRVRDRMPPPRLPRSRIQVRDTAGPQVDETLTELFGPLAGRVCGTGEQRDYLQLLFALVFVRNFAPRLWAQLRDAATEANQAQSPPQELLAKIGDLADRVLSQIDQRIGLRPAIQRLQPEGVDDLARVVGLSDTLGPETFRRLLDRYAAWTTSDNEKFFTPREVSGLMVDVLLNDGEGPLRCYDPFLRGGEILAEAASHFREVSLVGASPDRGALRLAGMNLALRGATAQLLQTSTAPWDAPHRPETLFDRIMTNPPFNSKGPATRPDRPWLFGPPPATNDNYAYLQYVIASLAPGGRAAVVMPNKAGVSDNDQERAIREEMIEWGAVEGIIALPAGLFPTTPIAVTVWLLSRPTRSRKSVLFLDARTMGTKSRNRRTLSADEQSMLAACVHQWRSGNGDYASALAGKATAVSVPIKEISDHDYSLNPADYHSPPTPSGHISVPVPHPADAVAEPCRTAQEADQQVASLLVAHATGPGPGSWTLRALSDLCELQSGPSPGVLSRLPRRDDGTPIVVPKHLQDRRIQATDPERVQPLSDKYRLAPDDLLCVRTGTTGPCAIATWEQAGWNFSSNLIRLRPRPDTDPYYLLGFLSLPSTVKWINDRAATSTTVPSISTKTLGTLQVPVPPLPEQQRIGTALCLLDDQITAHRGAAQAAVHLRTDLAQHLIDGILTTY